MKFDAGSTSEQVVSNRQTFLQANGMSIESTTLLRTVYADDVVYDRIVDVDKLDLGKGMLAADTAAPSDALFTALPGQALFLPIADCGGVVLYDSKRRVLGLVHLGRHATLDDLALKSVEHMIEKYGTDPADIYAWISPAISGKSYWLHTFDRAHVTEWQPHIREENNGWFVDLQGYNVDRFIEAGIPEGYIERSPVDVAKDGHYPSHYAATTRGEDGKSGRFAVAACMS